MRLPDRARLVLGRFLGRRATQDADAARAALEGSAVRIDALLQELRRSLAEALVLRRTAEAERDRLVAEAAASPTGDSRARERADAAEVELIELIRLEEMLGAAESELHDQVTEIRERLSATKRREAGVQALVDLTRAARAAEARSVAAREAVRELTARVAAAEARVAAAEARAEDRDSPESA